MRRLRAFLAWLLVGMLPLHGFASSAMLACGHAAHAAARPAAPAQDGHGPRLHAAQGAAGEDGQAQARPACAACTPACCHAPAATAISAEAAADPAPTRVAGPQTFATRIEPVPRKPPRA